jgi:hypothetical protein
VRCGKFMVTGHREADEKKKKEKEEEAEVDV